MDHMNFRQLIDKARRKGIADHRPPRTMDWLARQTGVSRPQLYNLIDGKQTAATWTVAKIAKGLKISPATVENALARSRAAQEMTS